MKCQWCGQELVFNRGWRHPEGGLYMVKCRECGWKGAPFQMPMFCPVCGSMEIVDDHRASPLQEQRGVDEGGKNVRN